MSGILLWAAAIAVAAALAIGVAGAGFAAAARAQASSAADAAALAGAAAGPTAARHAAERNGAELISYDHDGEIFTVEVDQNGVRQSASAERFEVPVSKNARRSHVSAPIYAIDWPT